MTLHRRLTAWLVAASLMLGGTFVTHCYVLERFSAAHHGDHAGRTSLVGFFCAAPFLLSCVTLLGAALVARGFVGGAATGLSAWPFGVLAPLGFLLHQYFTDFTGTTSPTYTSAAFLIGLALQVPLGLAAYVAARWLLRVVDRIGAVLKSGKSRVRHVFDPGWIAASKAPLSLLSIGEGAARAPPPVLC